MVAESHTSAGAQGGLSKTARLGASGIKDVAPGLFCERIGTSFIPSLETELT